MEAGVKKMGLFDEKAEDAKDIGDPKQTVN
jgi:hypothetical protein